MSLVSYENSSDSEDEEYSNTEQVEVKSSTMISSSEVTGLSSSDTNFFAALPQPIKQGTYITEEEDEFLKKREVQAEKPSKIKQPVKIIIPSLEQFNSDEDEPSKKKPKRQSKASGLFAVLPPPKSTLQTKPTQFIPNVLRTQNKRSKPVIVPPKRNVSDSDDDSDIPETFDDETWQKICGRQKRSAKPIAEPVVASTKPIELAPEAVKPYEGLDNKAFKELLGASSKRKGENIDVIDIKEDEVLLDKDVWMTKSLTDPEMTPKHVVKDPVNDTCRRKHHITYLAQQAKANEQDLKNQWAQNRFTRQRTQAKYGF